MCVCVCVAQGKTANRISWQPTLEPCFVTPRLPAYEAVNKAEHDGIKTAEITKITVNNQAANNKTKKQRNKYNKTNTNLNMNNNNKRNIAPEDQRKRQCQTHYLCYYYKFNNNENV